jgi:hypothetical protein
MAVDKKISQLASGAPAQAGDEYVVARSGANYKLTLTNIAASMPATTITSGNLTFSSTAQRITGDMSNATVANRLAFQTSTTNGSTVVHALPNGTATGAFFEANNGSDPTNAATMQIGVDGVLSARINAGIRGTGTYLPMTFNTGGSERVRIDTSGNLGVGTNTASFRVTNNFDAPAAWGNNSSNFIEMWQNSGTNALGVAMGDDSIASFTTNNGYNLVFATDGTERMRIATSTGNVGIGTASPSRKLEVGLLGAFRLQTGSVTMDCTPTAGATDSFVWNTSANAIYSWQMAGTERMRIDSSGNVGIGTTNLGTAGLSLSQTFNLSWEQSSTESIVNMFRQASSAATVVSNGYKRSATANGFASSYGSSWAKTALGLGVASGAITFYTDSAATAAVGTDVTPTERMRIDSSGNVGIGGAADAFAKFKITGTLPTSSSITVADYNAGTIPSGSTSAAYGYYSALGTQAASFTLFGLYHNYVNPAAFGAGSTVSNQYGYYAESTLTGATNNYGFFSNIAAASNRWNFYAAGTANNYFAGNIGIATTAITGVRLKTKGADTTSGTYAFAAVNSADTDLLFIRNDGAIYTGLTTNSPYNLTTGSAANAYLDSGGYLYRSTSSLRYKSDVTDATHGLADVLKLRSVTYKAKNSGDTVFGGLIAEEVHDAGLTEFVAYDKEGRPDALHYGNMVALLVKAVQELTARVAELEAK